MKKCAVVYASERGQTAKISRRIAEKFKARGLAVDLVNIESSQGLSLEGFDAIIIGSPLYRSKFNAHLEKWLKRSSSELSKKDTAFFMVCLNAADKRPEARVAEQELLKGFFKKTGFTPKHTAVFAGAVNYLEYGFLMRMLMKWICKKAGGPTDTSRDHELTDWAQVDQFADRIFAGD